MSAVGALIALAADFGAPLVRDALAKRLGGGNTQLAIDVAGAVARRAGVPVEDLERLAKDDPHLVGKAITETEQVEMPGLLSVYLREADARAELLTSEEREAPWKSAWRPGMMYLIGFLWLWSLLLQPAIDAWGPSVAPVPLATLMQLTVLYLGLYMGGHTVKAVAQKVGVGRGA